MLHFRLPLYTRNGQVGEHVLLLWFLALVLAGCCCHLICFEFVVLHFRLPIPKRADCRTRTYREETKKTLPRRPGHVAPRGAFSCRCANAAILNATSWLDCTYRGFPATLLSRLSPAPSIVDESLRTPVPGYTHTDLNVDTTKLAGGCSEGLGAF